MDSFRSSKLAPKLLGPYSVISQERNDIICTHCHLKTQHTFHSDRVSPFLDAPTDAAKLGLLDKEEYVVSAVLQHRGNLSRLNTVDVRITLGSRVLKCYTHTYMHVRCTYGCMYVQYKTTKGIYKYFFGVIIS